MTLARRIAKKRIARLAVLGIVLFPVLVLAQATGDSATQTQGMQLMQNVLDLFASSSTKWISVTQTAGLRLFGILAVIEMFFKGMSIIKRGDDAFGGTVIMLMQAFLTWGFFLWMIENPMTTLGLIPKSFQVLGGQASGLGSLNPSQMVGAGINIAVELASSVSTLTAVANPVVGLLTSGALVCIVAAFALLGFQMFAALMHYWILCGAASILLAGGALSHTRDWAIKQIQGAVSTGVNIFVIYLIAGVVTSIIPTWKAVLANGSITQVTPLLVMLAASLLIMFMAFKAPSIASGLMSGTSSMTANEGLAFGMGAMTLALGGAIAAAKGFSAALNGAGGVANALGGLGGGGGGSLKAGSIPMAQAFPSGGAGSASGAASGGGASGGAGAGVGTASGGSSGGAGGSGSGGGWGADAAAREDLDGLFGSQSGEYSDTAGDAPAAPTAGTGAGGTGTASATPSTTGGSTTNGAGTAGPAGSAGGGGGAKSAATGGGGGAAGGPGGNSSAGGSDSTKAPAPAMSDVGGWTPAQASSAGATGGPAPTPAQDPTASAPAQSATSAGVAQAGDASDAGIGGADAQPASASQPQPPQRSRLEQFNDMLKEGTDRARHAMPDASHQATLHIDHKGE